MVFIYRHLTHPTVRFLLPLVCSVFGNCLGAVNDNESNSKVINQDFFVICPFISFISEVKMCIIFSTKDFQGGEVDRR